MLKAPKNFFRTADSHKSSRGRLLLLAGSWGYVGAGMLAARGAITAGCGYLIWKVPEKIYPLVAPEFLDGVVKVLPDNLSDVYEENISATVAGPGWGQTDDMAELLQVVIADNSGPLVLDADALNLLKPQLEAFKARSAQTLITPHPAEAARLLACETAEVQNDRTTAVKELQKLSGATVVLKGSGTLVCSGAGVWKNEWDSATLATAGSGDVLAGMLGALLAAGVEADEAARFGVCWHGAAAKKLENQYGPQGIGASALFTALLATQKEMWDENTTGQ